MLSFMLTKSPSPSLALLATLSRSPVPAGFVVSPPPRLRARFATDEQIYLVMELAKGGHLFDRIMRDGSLTERYAASGSA